jgi:hypothetical protein
MDFVTKARGPSGEVNNGQITCGDRGLGLLVRVHHPACRVSALRKRDRASRDALQGKLNVCF